MRGGGGGLRDEIRDVARRAGIRADGHVPAPAIRRRRVQMSLVALVVVVGLVVVTLANDVWHFDSELTVADSGVARVLLVALAAAVVVYMIDVERHLRRLERLNREHEALNLALAGSLLETSLLADLEVRIGTSLDLGAVLDETLRVALTRLGNDRAAIYLCSEEQELRLAANRGREVRWPLRIAPRSPIELRDAASDAVEAIVPPIAEPTPAARGAGDSAPSALGAVMRSGVELIGAVVVADSSGRRFDSEEARFVEGLAEHAAVAIDNARHYEAVLFELDRTRDRLAEALRQSA